MQGCNPLLLCRRPTRIHAGLLPLVPTATVLFSPFEAVLPRRTQDAEGMIRQAIALSPGDSAFHYNLGHAFREQGQMDAAIAAYRP
jgi:hypothetical protein